MHQEIRAQGTQTHGKMLCWAETHRNTQCSADISPSPVRLSVQGPSGQASDTARMPQITLGACGCRLCAPPHPKGSPPVSPPLCRSLPCPLSLWEIQFKKKTKKEKQNKQATTTRGLQIQQAKYTARFRWEGATSPTDQPQIGVCYLHFSQALCTAQSGTRSPPPTPQHNNVVHSSVPNPRRGEGRAKERARGDEIREVVVGGLEPQASEEIYL